LHFEYAFDVNYNYTLSKFLMHMCCSQESRVKLRSGI